MKIAILSMLMFLRLAANAQTDTPPDAAKLVDHIEVHGQTDIGDTAIVYFKDGGTERYVLNNPLEKKRFDRTYGALLAHQAPIQKEQDQATSRHDHQRVYYEPLNPIPENVSEITFGEETVWLKLKNGVEEQYDLTNEAEKKSFESQYGKLKIKKEIQNSRK